MDEVLLVQIVLILHPLRVGEGYDKDGDEDIFRIFQCCDDVAVPREQDVLFINDRPLVSEKCRSGIENYSDRIDVLMGFNSLR